MLSKYLDDFFQLINLYKFDVFFRLGLRKQSQELGFSDVTCLTLTF